MNLNKLNRDLRGIARPWLLRTTAIKRLYELAFWLTYRCVYDCDCCLITEKDYILDKNKIFSMVDSALALRLTRVAISGGEPLLHPDFLEICRYITERNLSLVIHTTGKDFNDELVERVYDGPGFVKIDLTINSVDPEINDLTRKKGAFEDSVGLARRLKLKDKNMGVTVVVDRRNLHTVPETTRFLFEELSPHSVSVYLGAPLGQYVKHAKDFMLTDEEILDFHWLLTDLAREWEEKGKLFSPIAIVYGSPSYCPALYGSLNVLPSGNLSTCCYYLDDDMRIGTIDEPIEEVLSFSRFQKLKKKYKRLFYNLDERKRKIGVFSCFECAVNYQKLFKGRDLRTE